MQKNLSNKELVAAGHKFAANISADTPLLDMAKMVSELATQLDAALAAAAEACKQRDQLAAENATLVNYIDGECYTESKRTGVYTCAGINKPASPATNAYLNAMRAEGADAFAHTQRLIADEQALNGHSEHARQRRIWASYAEQFAAQLRASNAGKDGV